MILKIRIFIITVLNRLRLRRCFCSCGEQVIDNFIVFGYRKRLLRYYITNNEVCDQCATEIYGDAQIKINKYKKYLEDSKFGFTFNKK